MAPGRPASIKSTRLKETAFSLTIIKAACLLVCDLSRTEVIMLVRQQSDAGLFSQLSRRKLEPKIMSGSSPLLLLSKPEVTQDWPCSESTLDGTAIRGNDCSEPDPMAMKVCTYMCS